MPSETEGQLIQKSISPNPKDRVENQPILPGEKPVNFAKRILAERFATQQQQQPKPPLTQQTVEQVIEQVRVEEAKPVELKPEPTPDFGLEPKKEVVLESKPAEPIGADLSSSSEAQELPDEPVPGSLPANYKLLKIQYKEKKQNLLKLTEEKQQLEQELEKYRTGTVVPEVLQQKENEIARLQTYEKLVNVKGSRAYKEQIIEPLTRNDNEIKQLFKDYDIPESEVSRFTALTNRADRNRFLAEHFDARGADQAEQLLQKSTEIRKRSAELESGSKDAIQTLEAEHQRIEGERDARRKETIAENARDSWVRALAKIRAEGRIKELIPKVNDQEFNQKFVTPILTAASVEYGKFVKKLAESGIQELTPELAEYAANMSLRAHAQALAQTTRDAALQYAEEAEEGTRIGNGYFRPAVGGGVPSISSRAAPKQNLEQGVEGVLDSIIAKRR